MIASTPQQLAQDVLDAHLRTRTLTARMAVVANAMVTTSTHAVMRARAADLAALKEQLSAEEDALGRAIEAYRDRVEALDAHRLDLQRQLDARAEADRRAAEERRAA